MTVASYVFIISLHHAKMQTLNVLLCKRGEVTYISTESNVKCILNCMILFTDENISSALPALTFKIQSNRCKCRYVMCFWRRNENEFLIMKRGREKKRKIKEKRTTDECTHLELDKFLDWTIHPNNGRYKLNYQHQWSNMCLHYRVN